MTYVVFFPVRKGDAAHPLNNMKEIDWKYEAVAVIDTDSTESVFRLCQNHNEDYTGLRLRNMSVGDIVYTPDGDKFMVNGIGWTDVKEDIDLPVLKK